MRRRVVLALGVVLLGLVGCAGQVAIPDPGSLLYVTTFDAFNEDWQLYEGELSAQVIGAEGDNVLQIAVDSAQAGAFTVMERPFGDFDVQVQVQQVAGPEDIDAPGFGLIFRHQDNNNFYAFMISGDGYYQVFRRVDGSDTVLSDWAPTDNIAQGQAVNTIRVTAQGDTFQFMVNDQPLPLCLTIWNPMTPGECQVPAADPGGEPTWSTDAVSLTLTDGTFPQGQIGLGARSFSSAGVRVNFDDMLVCGPFAAPPVPFQCSGAAE